MLELSTDIIVERLKLFLSTAYSNLFREYYLFTLAMLISCVILPITIIRILSKYEQKCAKKKSWSYKIYTFKTTAKLGLHYIVIIFMPLSAGWQLYANIQDVNNFAIYGNELIICGILLLLLALFASLYLYRLRSKGLAAMVAYVILFAAYKQYPWITCVLSDMSSLNNYTTVGQYGVYVAHDYWLTLSMAVSLLALIVLVLLSLYYYKRRFLFTPGRLGISSCRHCGKPIVKKDHYCTCCGRELMFEYPERNINALDKELFCAQCGTYINDSPCNVCNSKMSDYVKKTLREELKEQKKSVRLGLVLSAVFIIIIIYANFMGALTRLTNGSREVNNAYMKEWEEFCNDYTKAADPEWIAGFDAAVEALYIIDTRWYYVDPRSVQSNSIPYYVQYSMASFHQMMVLEQSKEFVHSVAKKQGKVEGLESGMAALGTEFHQTNQEQSMALQYFQTNTSQEHIVEQFGYICFNGVRFCLPQINITLVAIFMMISCFIMFIYLLNTFSITLETRCESRIHKCSEKAEYRIQKYRNDCYVLLPASTLRRVLVIGIWCSDCMFRILNELWILFVKVIGVIILFLSVFRIRNISSCIRWIRAGLKDKYNISPDNYKEFKRKQRIGNICAFVITSVLVVMIYAGNYMFPRFFDRIDNTAAEEQYLFAATAAMSEYFVDISNAMLSMQNNMALSEEEKQELYQLIDAQIKADQAILDYDMAGLEDYEEVHAVLCGLCRADLEVVQDIKECMDQDTIPSMQLQQNFISLRGEKYMWAMRQLGLEVVEFAVEQMFNIN